MMCPLHALIINYFIIFNFFLSCTVSKEVYSWGCGEYGEIYNFRTLLHSMFNAVRKKNLTNALNLIFIFLRRSFGPRK